MPGILFTSEIREIDTSNPAVAQFVENFSHICHFLSRWCKETGSKKFLALGDDQPLCLSAFAILLRADPDYLSRSLLSFITDETMGLLGREVALRNASVSPDLSRWAIAELQGGQYEAGLYCGSSMDCCTRARERM